MTVTTFTDSSNRLTFTADASTVSYTFNFEIADENSIEVFVSGVKKSLTTDYSISFDSGNSGTGNIIFTTAPSSSATIILKRDTSIIRASDFQTSGSFLASTVNAEFDRLTQAIQEVDDKVENRVLRVEHYDSTPTDFTVPTSRANQYLKFDSSGDINITDSFEGSTITTSGNVSVGGNLAVTGSLSLASLSVSGNVSGTLTTVAQPNITSLGTLSTLTVDNINLNGNTIVSDTGTLAIDDNTTVNGTIVASSGITGSTLTGTLQTAAQANITSLGTLSTLTVDNININGNTIVSDNGTLAIDDNTTVNGSLTATTLGGTLSTAAQTNITSLGTLTAVTVDNININGNTIVSDTGTLAIDDNTTVNGSLTATTLAGTLTTAAQANVTSLGTLTNLQVDNVNVNGNTISTSSGNLTLSNLTSVSIDDINFADNVIKATSTNADLEFEANGTGQISVNDHRIVNLADAVANKDAVSKGFLNTTLTNAGISPTGATTFQSTIESGSSRVEVESVDGDVHIALASSTLYKFEASEIESLNPIRLTGDIPLFANKNSIATSQTITTASGYNYVTFGDITIDNGATVTISNGSSFRVI